VALDNGAVADLVLYLPDIGHGGPRDSSDVALFDRKDQKKKKWTNGKLFPLQLRLRLGHWLDLIIDEHIVGLSRDPQYFPQFPECRYVL